MNTLVTDVLRKVAVGLLTALPIAMFALVPSDHAQNVTLRFLDFRTGQPIKGLKVTVTAFNEYGEHGSVLEKTIAFRIFRKTDQDGQVVVDFAESLSNHIRIWADLSESVPDFSPAEVLKSGLVLPYLKSTIKPMASTSLRPAEVVIVNKRVTTGDRMRQEIP